MNTNSDIYKMTAAINKARKAVQIWDHPFEEKYVLDNIYAFSRGPMFVAVTNGSEQVQVSSDVKSNWNDGTTVCNIFSPDSDCQTIQGGKLNLTLMNGESKIYLPKSSSFFNTEEVKAEDFLN
jgi:alpha-amylase